MPKIMMTMGQISTVCVMTPVCCASVMSPQMSIMTPMAMPTMAPPWGSPKHSCC